MLTFPDVTKTNRSNRIINQFKKLSLPAFFPPPALLAVLKSKIIKFWSTTRIQKSAPESTESSWFMQLSTLNHSRYHKYTIYTWRAVVHTATFLPVGEKVSSSKDRNIREMDTKCAMHSVLPGKWLCVHTSDISAWEKCTVTLANSLTLCKIWLSCIPLSLHWLRFRKRYGSKTEIRMV